jgi:hypothetical protein
MKMEIDLIPREPGDLVRVFMLLIAFQIKHWLADYPLQTRHMLKKFRDDWGFFFPLLLHAQIHAGFTLLIAAGTGATFELALGLAMFDMVVHFVMDRIKASKRYLGRWQTLTASTAPGATEKQWRSNNYFWWTVGFDQMVHHLTHYLIIWWLVT